MAKIGFLGAMNRDVVVQQRAASLLPALGLDAPTLVETPVSDEVAQQGADLFSRMGASTWHGGSAFNVARIVALLNRDAALDLAFFGIAGSVDGTLPHLVALHEWSVDSDGVSASPLPPATCLAMVEPAGRTLLTAQGANAAIAAWLVANRNELVTAIARCDVVHVTSFLDHATPGLIAEILAVSRVLNPSLVVSLDPGMAWIAPGGEGFAALLRQTRILHLNAEEFAVLGGGDAVKSMGEALAPGWLVVARNHAGATLYAAGANGFSTQSLPDRPPAADFIATDPNGAGDTFCGGFLWAYARNLTQPLKAADLGFTLARRKVTINGPLTAEAIEAAMAGLGNW
jgi:sugar/nucleoside kinase (ribokinase family)